MLNEEAHQIQMSTLLQHALSPTSLYVPVLLLIYLFLFLYQEIDITVTTTSTVDL